MIGKLTGTIEQVHHNPLIVSVHDVGYLVHIPEAIRKTLAEGTPASLYIYTHVREDALDLFGFPTTEDLQLFKLLLSVSGIGPKTALGVMDKGATAIEKAIRESDVNFFMAVPRLGKKNAQKLIIELKNKLGSLKDLDLTQDTEASDAIVDALVSMGFVKKDVIEVLKHVDAGASDEVTIRQALKLLAK